jgi:hypothetical protein
MRIKQRERLKLRPVYGYVLAAIVLLGVAGGIAAVFRNDGRAPVNEPIKAPINR